MTSHSGDAVSEKLDRLNLLLGLLLLVISISAGLAEWGVALGPFRTLVNLLVIVAFFVMAPSAKGGRRIFAGAAVLITLVAMVVSEEWQSILGNSLSRTAFLIAFFASMTSVGIPARVSPAIMRCGTFLAQQPPGRRYAALTIGGQLFSIFLNYGSIVLLGNMAVANAKTEKDERVRQIRTKRMLLAIHRAMVSTIPWSPLSFSVTMTLIMIPQTDWPHMVVPGLVTGVSMGFVGWALDTIFKPTPVRPMQPRADRRVEGTWFTLWPLLLLLVLLATLLLGINALTGVRIPGVIIVVAPMLALGWLALQSRGPDMLGKVIQRAGVYASTDLPLMRKELLVLMMAGYVGSVGGALMAPVAAGMNFDLSALPPVVVLLAMVWIVPLVGQFGIHPLLAVSVIFPMMPSAAEMGVDPAAVATAILAGWGLASASTPFTATVVLIGSFAGASANEVARKWNGPYALILGVVLSLWVVIYSMIAG